MPALPLDDAGPYVAAAYLVFLALILVYFAIMAVKLRRIERDTTQLAELVATRAQNLEQAVPRHREGPPVLATVGDHSVDSVEQLPS